MEEICTDILAIISPEAAKKNIQLITDIQPNLTSANLDRRRITQSIIHLMSNAVKFTNNGGKVKLKITSILKSSEIPWLVIYVIDNGIGISAKDINTLFQPFVQLDSGLNRQYEGTGLGLVLVKKIVEQHGGKVKVKSEVGKGSCFMIELPYAK
ncbi:sensor histidine kinase [Calothrix sp. 336/3]|uniref:sensor histidine kinase n=1 Tax=Calothrix sp. 336/3 TaxID=1337936 RepID=UPI0021117167|nr:ATP-binding protein [Calothrix sp. 336/3]